MNGANEPLHTQPTPDSAGFCQHCGKPLTPETVRKIGPAVYCEPCLAQRLHTPPQPEPAPGYRPVNAGPQTAAWTAAALNQSGPNPGLAALLGLIPGVGAMYNEQYAKGIVHLIVFAVLCSLASDVNGIFGLFVAGWIFYMAIEAHHTARARRDGTLLPNPFGLNDIGERLGFGKAWPTGPSVAEVASDAAAAATQAAQQASQTSRPYYPPPTPPWGAPAETVIPQQPIPGAAAYTQPFAAYTQPDAPYANAYRDMGYSAYPGPIPTANANPNAGYTPIPPAHAAPYPYQPVPNRFPAGAVVLIALGTVFLLTTTGIFSGFPPEAAVGTILLGFSAWFFLRRMTESPTLLPGSSLAPTPTFRVYSALRVSVWPALIGLLLLLDGFDILRWSHSWPFVLILAGVMALLGGAAWHTPYLPPIPAPIPDPIPDPIPPRATWPETGASSSTAAAPSSRVDLGEAKTSTETGPTNSTEGAQ